MARRRRLAVAGALIATAGAAAAGVWAGHDATTSPEPAAAESTTSTSTSATTAAAAATAAPPTVYGAPGEPEADDPTDIATDAPVTTSPPAPDQLSIFLTYADWDAATGAVEVDGYLTGIVEDGGTCRLTLTRGGAMVSASVPGTADATTTSCGGAAIGGTRLSSGTWTAVLSYASPTSAGTSHPVEVTVP